MKDAMDNLWLNEWLTSCYFEQIDFIEDLKMFWQLIHKKNPIASMWRQISYAKK